MSLYVSYVWPNVPVVFLSVCLRTDECHSSSQQFYGFCLGPIRTQHDGVLCVRSPSADVWLQGALLLVFSFQRRKSTCFSLSRDPTRIRAASFPSCRRFLRFAFWGVSWSRHSICSIVESQTQIRSEFVAYRLTDYRFHVHRIVCSIHLAGVVLYSSHGFFSLFFCFFPWRACGIFVMLRIDCLLSWILVIFVCKQQVHHWQWNISQETSRLILFEAPIGKALDNANQTKLYKSSLYKVLCCALWG